MTARKRWRERDREGKIESQTEGEGQKEKERGSGRERGTEGEKERFKTPLLNEYSNLSWDPHVLPPQIKNRKTAHVSDPYFISHYREMKEGERERERERETERKKR